MGKYFITGIVFMCSIISLLAQRPVDTLMGLPLIGTVTPQSSKEIKASYWGIQSGTLNNNTLKYAGKIGVKWTRIMAQ